MTTDVPIPINAIHALANNKHTNESVVVLVVPMRSETKRQTPSTKVELTDKVSEEEYLEFMSRPYEPRKKKSTQ
jgi:hypothetical protein